MVESKVAVPAPAEGDKKEEKRKVVETKEAELVSIRSSDDRRQPAILLQAPDDIAQLRSRDPERNNSILRVSR